MEIQPDVVLVQKYSIISKIGEGCFGRVYKGLDLKRKEYVAIKQVPLKKFQEQPKLKELFQAEVSILQRVKSENVVSFVDYFDTSDASFLVLEFCDSGDLEQYLKKRKTIPEDEAVEFFKQILNGFKGLHEIPAIHRDIKAANILIHNNNILKIADLGFGKIMKSTDITRTILGTSMTMAPEVLENKPYSLEVDVYSLGVIFYQMLFGVFPFNGRSDPELLRNIKTKQLNLQPNSIKISSEMKDLLSQMICYDRTKRIKWPEIYQHKVFAEGKKIATNNVSLAHLVSSRIQIGVNRDFYQKNAKNLFPNENFGNEFLSNENGFNGQFKQPQNLQPPQQHPFQQQQQNYQPQQQYQNYNNVQPSLPGQLYNNNPMNNNYPNLSNNQNNNNYNYGYNNNGYNNNNSPSNNSNQVAFQNAEIQKIKEEVNQNQIIKENVNKVAERYLHYRNVYGQMIKAVDSAHSLPKTSINTYVPVFLIQKKLYNMNKTLLNSLVNKKNIFDLKYFQQFLTSPFYKSCLTLVSDEEQIIKLYFQKLRDEVQMILQNMNMPNADLENEVQKEELTPRYMDLLKLTISNYQMNLEQERPRFNQQDQTSIFIHEVQVLEFVVIDNLMNQLDFNFEEHNQQILNTPFQKFDEIIGEKFMLLF